MLVEVYPPLPKDASVPHPLPRNYCRVYCEGRLLALFDTFDPNYDTAAKVAAAIQEQFRNGPPPWYPWPKGQRRSPDLVAWYDEWVVAVLCPHQPYDKGALPHVLWLNEASI